MIPLWDTWVTQSVKCLTHDFYSSHDLDSGHDFKDREIKHPIGLCTQHEVGLGFLTSPSAPLPTHTPSLSR